MASFRQLERRIAEIFRKNIRTLEQSNADFAIVENTRASTRDLVDVTREPIHAPPVSMLCSMSVVSSCSYMPRTFAISSAFAPRRNFYPPVHETLDHDRPMISYRAPTTGALRRYKECYDRYGVTKIDPSQKPRKGDDFEAVKHNDWEWGDAQRVWAAK